MAKSKCRRRGLPSAPSVRLCSGVFSGGCGERLVSCPAACDPCGAKLANAWQHAVRRFVIKRWRRQTPQRGGGFTPIKITVVGGFRRLARFPRFLLYRLALASVEFDRFRIRPI